MTTDLIKRLLDAFYLAKRVRDMLPVLPECVMPSYIQYLDTIQKLQGQGMQVKVSDISDALDLPRPGVTRTVKEMERSSGRWPQSCGLIKRFYTELQLKSLKKILIA